MRNGNQQISWKWIVLYFVSHTLNIKHWTVNRFYGIKWNPRQFQPTKRLSFSFSFLFFNASSISSSLVRHTIIGTIPRSSLSSFLFWFVVSANCQRLNLIFVHQKLCLSVPMHFNYKCEKYLCTEEWAFE